jgi:hypothetical protein
MLNQLVNFLVGFVVLFSLLTLLCGILLLILQNYKKKSGVNLVKSVTVITGVLAATGTLWVKATGAHVTPPDEARETINAFYHHVEGKDFSQAYDLIHSARKDEMKLQKRDYNGFKDAYASTRDYRNLQITFDKAEEETSSRWFLVAYDVKDAFPLNTLREESWLSSSVLINAGLIDQQKLSEILLADIRRDYVLPEDSNPKVMEYVRRAPLHFLFEPSFVTDVADFLRLSSKQGSGKDSWSHHIEHLRLQRQDGWKIREGLHPPLFLAQYPPGVEPPVLLKSP